MSFVLDTNVVIYHLHGELAGLLPAETYFLSVISELELLSFPGITPQMEHALRQFLRSIIVVDITPEIHRATVFIRRIERLRLPDAIIAATAQVLDCELLTNDQKLLRSNSIRSRPMMPRTS